MAPLTATMYYAAITSLANKEIDWLDDTVKVMLVDGTYTHSQTSHRYKSSVTGEVVGTGYTARGNTLANKTESFNGQIKVFGADDSVWTELYVSPRGAVVYVDTGVDATSPLIAYVDFGRVLPTNGDGLGITWAYGLLNVTIA